MLKKKEPLTQTFAPNRGVRKEIDSVAVEGMGSGLVSPPVEILFILSVGRLDFQ